MGHYVYKYVNGTEIIYIGKNNGDLHTRIRAHGKPGDNIPKEAWPELNKATVYYTELFNANMTDFVESELIRRYKPKWNMAKKEKQWSGLPIGEPEWILYNPLYKDMDKTPSYMLPPYTTAKLRDLIKRFDEDWGRWILLKLIEDAGKKYRFEYDKHLKSDIANLNISRYFAIYNSFNHNPSLFLINPRKKVYVPSKNKYILWCEHIYHDKYTGDMYAIISKQEVINNANDYQESLLYYTERISKVLEVLKAGYSDKLPEEDISHENYSSYRENNMKRKCTLFENYHDEVMDIEKVVLVNGNFDQSGTFKSSLG